MIDILCTVCRICFNIFELAIMAVQLVWNFYVVYYTIGLIIFFFNNLAFFIIVCIFFPAIIGNCFSFASNALVNIHSRERG
jgi:hypothetical protein